MARRLRRLLFMRIAFFVRPTRADAPDAPIAPQVSSTTRRTVDLLRAAGHAVDLVLPEAEAHDLLALESAHDLYVLKSKTSLALSLAAALIARGARTVNSLASSRLVKDKVAHTPVLAAAGVPLPASWAVCGPDELLQLLDHHGPLIVKPPGGSMAAGVLRLESPHDLTQAHRDQLAAHCRDALGLPQPLLVQEALSEEADETKAYAVDDWVAAVTPAGAEVSVPSDVREVVLACGRALGLELYGVDVMRHGDRLAVVDVNGYPSYEGVAGGAERVAAYVGRCG